MAAGGGGEDGRRPGIVSLTCALRARPRGRPHLSCPLFQHRRSRVNVLWSVATRLRVYRYSSNRTNRFQSSQEWS